MAEKAIVEKESSSSFAPYFGLHHGYYKFDYDAASPCEKRMLAVACALEVIKGQGSVDHHMGQLSAYADAIQDALNVRK